MPGGRNAVYAWRQECSACLKPLKGEGGRDRTARYEPAGGCGRSGSVNERVALILQAGVGALEDCCKENG